MPTVEANGIHIYYEIHGNGKPLVLIGGLAIDLTVFERVGEELSRRYQVIAFDNRGAGRTDKPDIPYSIEMMADDTAGLLKALGIESAHILGVSMGGRIALDLTLRYPHLVRSLILVSTFATRTQMTWPRRLLDVYLRMPILRTLGKRYPQPYYAVMRQRDAWRDYDASDRLREIRVPTLIVHGTGDRLAPYELAEDMHASIHGSKIILFDGGHHIMFSHQAQFLDVVSAFLELQTANQANR
jgi:3-oxoadipate enol-lactonase